MLSHAELYLVPNTHTLKALIRIPLVGFALCRPRLLPYEAFMSSIHLSMNLLSFVPNRCSSQSLIIQAIRSSPPETSICSSRTTNIAAQARNGVMITLRVLALCIIVHCLCIASRYASHACALAWRVVTRWP